MPKIIQFPLEALLLFVTNGNLSVAIFFVLSGFVLSYSFFVNHRDNLLMIPSIKRYPRLTVPVLASVLVVSFLFSYHLFYTKEVLEGLGITGKLPFYNSMIRTDILIALQEGIWGCLLDGTNYHNDVLWTMSIEFYGSMLVFALLAIFGKYSVRYIAYACLLIYFRNSFYYLFITGVVLADLASVKSEINRPYVGLCLIAAGFIISIFYYNNSLYNFFPFGELTELKRFAFNRVAAVCIVAGILFSKQLKNLFATNFLLLLGKISFVLYLFHNPFISIVSVFFLKLFIPVWPYYLAIQLVFFITGILLILFSRYVLIYIDKWAIVLSNRLANLIERKFIRA